MVAPRWSNGAGVLRRRRARSAVCRPLTSLDLIWESASVCFAIGIVKCDVASVSEPARRTPPWFDRRCVKQ